MGHRLQPIPGSRRRQKAQVLPTSVIRSRAGAGRDGYKRAMAMAMAAAPAGSKCFLVTGPPGVGKTTLITRVVEALRTSHPHLNIQGFYTREVREGSDRIGFEVVTLDGKRGPLASSKVSSTESLRWPTVGKYKVDVASFESLALPLLQVKEGIDLFIVDELSLVVIFLEMPFRETLIHLQLQPINLLHAQLVFKLKKHVARLRNHPGATIFTLNPGNRDAMKDAIYSQIVNLLPNKSKC